MELVSQENISTTLKRAVELGLVEAEDTSVIFLDLRVIKDRIDRLNQAFPETSLHAVAVKSNPLHCVLKYLGSLGTGLEAASIPEVVMASRAGIPNEKLVFDSPAKTRSEISFLREQYPGIRINADSLDELRRYPATKSGFQLGLRINPEVNSATVASMNVGGSYSKFGHPISDRAKIIEHCIKWQDVDCLHFHIGSQHQRFEPVYEAVKLVSGLANEINASVRHKKITTIDIGGGFPVNYQGEPHAIEPFVAEMKKECPLLFDGTFELVTEFGRFVHANAGWVATRVEYTKRTPDGQTAIVHVGADMFLRECYNPKDWHHSNFVLDQAFNLKNGPKTKVDIAGPLCFGGDFVDRQVDLPKIETGDWLAVGDIGANTFSLWSRHCSRPFPKVIVYDDDRLSIAKQRETCEAIVEFWK